MIFQSIPGGSFLLREGASSAVFYDGSSCPTTSFFFERMIDPLRPPRCRYARPPPLLIAQVSEDFSPSSRFQYRGLFFFHVEDSMISPPTLFRVSASGYSVPRQLRTRPAYSYFDTFEELPPVLSLHPPDSNRKAL